jgi:hypothetical protein
LLFLRLGCCFAYLLCPLGVYFSYRAPPSIAIVFPISQLCDQSLLPNEILGQRLHLERQCKMPAWLSQQYATLSVCITRGVISNHPFLSRASCRVTSIPRIAGMAPPLYFSQHCGNSSSHPPLTLLIFVLLRSFFDWARSCDSAFERLVLRSGLSINLLVRISISSPVTRSAGSSSLLPGCHRLYPISHPLTVRHG